jgi:autotransporter translocation and assembly factor TamB
VEAEGTRSTSTNAVSFQLNAGQLSAMGKGTIDIARETADMDFTASAPAMDLRPDLKWQSLAADGHFHGPFTRPDVAANVDVRALSAFGTNVSQLIAKVQGNIGDVRFTGNASGLMLPGDQEQLFARQSIALEGRIDLAAARRPFQITVTHPLLSLSAAGESAVPVNGRLSVEAPDLAPFTRLEEIDLGGRAKVDIQLTSSDSAYRIAAQGTIESLGNSVFARLTGRHATFGSTVAISGTTATISDARFDAPKLTARLSGSFRDGTLDVRSAVRLPDVSVLLPRLKGDFALDVGAVGPLERARLTAKGGGNLGTDGFAPQRVSVTAQAQGFPLPQSASFAVTGNFDNAPVMVNGDVTHPDGKAFLVSLKQAEWKTVRAIASIAVPNAAPVTGAASVSVGNLRDLAAFAGTTLDGFVRPVLS